jgi:hypothetical protein
MTDKKKTETCRFINRLTTKLYLSDLKTQSVPRSKHSASVIKTDQLMVYSEIMAVCSEIHTRHTTWTIFKDPVRTAL